MKWNPNALATVLRHQPGGEPEYRPYHRNLPAMVSGSDVVLGSHIPLGEIKSGWRLEYVDRPGLQFAIEQIDVMETEGGKRTRLVVAEV